MTVLWPNGRTTPPNFSWQGQFGPRDADLSFASSYHRGQDFYGLGIVRAIAAGTVVHSGTRSGWYGGGQMVWIQHDGFFSRSLHLASTTVTVGQTVEPGDPIGVEGHTPHAAGVMAVHLHLEITLGAWHAANTGQIDPRAFLEERVGEDTTEAPAGVGGASPDDSPDTAADSGEEEEDDMKLVRITNGIHEGRHYAIGQEYIKQITSKTSVKLYEDAFKTTERPVSQKTLTAILGIHGIPSHVISRGGGILDDLNGQGKFVRGGTWSTAQKTQRLAYLAQKR
ncbi:M23 family metallopeptidase [Microbacterium excoecariae]|uniref:M23 family metallopeptidase n=1 Tax=Microbacterium excoecariae TaxID=2715210 RepID=UPI00140BCD75|nr:M23 family metallopeptidase [Microbacterium excoecariae]NHI16877.1 M23 family metallopeptidase [Microbacterium excoecariae]